MQEKLLALFMVLSLSGVAALISYQLVTSYNEENEKNEINNTNLALVIEHYLTQSFTTADYALMKIKEHVEDKLSAGNKLEKLNLDSYLQGHGTLGGTISGFRICNSSGKVIYPSGLPTTQAKCDDREYFVLQKSHPELGLYISDPMFGRIAQQMIMILSRRINNARGEFAGTVHVSFKIAELSKFFSTLNMGNNGSISVWSNKRILVARHPYVTDQIGKYIVARPAVEEALKKKSVLTIDYEDYSSIDSIKRKFHFRKLSHYPFHIILGSTSETILKNWTERFIVILIGAALVLISSTVVFIYYLRSLKLLQAEREINLQNAKMTALGEMAAGIAHEINNPLAIISTQARQLKRYIQGSDQQSQDALKGLDKIEKTALRIGKIIVALRTYSRNSEIDPPQIISLKDLINDTLEFCHQRFQESGISILVDCPDDLVTECKAIQLSQVLLNLLNNSYDAICSLDEKWIRLKVENFRDKILITLTDSGSGISSDVNEKMMSPFFTTKPVGQGTGLGLSISMKIVQGHNGKLYYDPDEKHTTFKIELPLIYAQTNKAALKKRPQYAAFFILLSTNNIDT